MTRPSREFDLVVWGASGFTGRLVAAAVARSAPKGLRWALGGRNATRLERLRTELGVELPLVAADARDDAAMAALAARTRVVVSTVGPYARYGTPLASACAAAGTDHADITGELLWMRRTIDTLDAPARASGARLVHACGFDSVPTDLGLWLLQTTAVEHFGRPCADVEHTFGPLVGGVSGGTIASALELGAAVAAQPALRALLDDPDMLAPGGAPTPREPTPWLPRRRGGAWTAPFAMAAINSRVARRTRALLGEPWGTFRYDERLRVGSWPTAAAIGAAWVLAPALLPFAPLRRLVATLAPRPGEGPSATTRARGSFRSTLVGRLVAPATSGARPRGDVVVTTGADLDPGYGATAVMLAQVGLMLAAGEVDAPGGVRTPASLGGRRLLERLAGAGIRIDVQEPIGGASTRRHGGTLRGTEEPT
jgi:short subunit dehydrogenase-like uncharacterized protein